MNTSVTTTLLLGIALAGPASAAAAEGAVQPWARVCAEYRDFPSMVAALEDLAARHPGIAVLVDVGGRFSVPCTRQGRTLWALKISDNAALDEDEPAVLIVSGLHGREMAPPEIALALAAALLEGYSQDPRVTAWVNGNELWVAPVWNPDGFSYARAEDPYWRKNVGPAGRGSGVDLNRNFPFGWDGPHAGQELQFSETYRGPSPASEPETQALLALSRDRRFAKVLDIHSCGREVLYTYFDPTSFPPRLEAWHASKAGELSAALQYDGRTGKPSAEGEFYQWALCELGAFAFLVEIGLDLFPSAEAVRHEAGMVFSGLAWLLDHEIPVKGHVTEAGSGAPIEAEIAVRGIRYGRGETRRSNPATGRFHCFLPPGSYEADIIAPGYASRCVAFTVEPGRPAVVEVQLGPRASLIASGTPLPGGIVRVILEAAGAPGRGYLLAASCSDQGFGLEDGRWFPIGADALFLSSAGTPANWSGTLDAAGRAEATLDIPAGWCSAGLALHLAFCTFEKAWWRPADISAPVTLVVEE